jgi:hypothetical protein
LQAHANNKKEKEISKHMEENKRSKQFEKKNKSLHLEDVD